MRTMTASSPRVAAATQPEKLKAVLEKLYDKYNHRELIKPDPLQFVYEYSKPADMEIAGLLAACLAYGRVEQIESSLRNLLGRMGKSPSDFVLNFIHRDKVSLKGFKHRFNTADDVSDLLTLLRNVLVKYGSIERFFLLVFSPADENIVPALSRFCDSLLNMWHGLPARANTARPVLSEVEGMAVPRGLAFLLAGPNHGGAAKRLNLFLRWMVRSDDVDAGLWRSVDKSKLVVPVDVHMGRLCRILGFHNHSNVSLKTAVEITRNFAEIEPTDPVKYDFALSRIGILENCTGRRREECNACELLSWCLKRQDW